MKPVKKLLEYKNVQILLLLCASWALFNLVFFLGTNPTQLIDAAFQSLFIYVWNTVKNIPLRDFLVFGFLTGLSGFLVYVPNIILLFFFSHLLFETGLSLKAARILDPLLRAWGLNGNSFSPLLFGFGCSVNALHSAQSISNRKNRLLTMLISPFMSCGSKHGVYMLLISVVFPVSQAGTVLFGLYLFGIGFSMVSTLLYRRLLKIKKDDTAEEVANPSLRIPRLSTILKKTLFDGWIFVSRAGSVIVGASLVIWALSYWPGISQEKYDALALHAQETGQQIPSRITLSFHTSYFAKFGQFIEPLFRPLGQNWKNSAALLSSLTGRGVIVSTLITAYGIEYSPQGKKTLVHALSADKTFSKLSACALMLFVLLCGGCLASVTMFFHETKSIFLTTLFVMYPLLMEWILSTVFYQAGRLIIGAL